jgi:hypothetical protein
MAEKSIIPLMPVPLDAEQKKIEIYFDARKMSPSVHQFVCWIDVMGSQSAMSRSLPMAANFLMKLHIAALTAHKAYTLDIYPVIDGVTYAREAF